MRNDTYRTSQLLAQFNRLPETARFYSVLSALVVILAVATGLTMHREDAGPGLELNPRTPLFDHLSPWGHVLDETGGGYLKSSFDVIGVLTPLTESAASSRYTADAGEDLESIAAREGIDLDLLASANSVSYAKMPRRKTDIRLPLLYSRDRPWDRSLEFLYPIAMTAPVGGNGKAKKGAPTFVNHIVAYGDCLWDIARKYHVSMETIVAVNDLTSARLLRPGQLLEVPDTDGTYVKVKKGTTISGICKKYEVDLADLVNANPGVDVERLMPGQKLFVPGQGALAEIFRFHWPVHGRISSRYGVRYHPIYHRRMMHTGLDIAARHGTPIRAALDGRVTFTGWKGGYGRTVIIEHPNGFETLYGHCSSITVKTGATVKRGQEIAKVGTTGVSTGPHVHFEVRENKKRINPERVLY